MDKVQHYKQQIKSALVAEFNKPRSHNFTRISTEKLYPEYFTCTGELDFASFEAFGQAITESINDGLFSATFDRKKGIYTSISATKEQAAAIASELHLVSRDLYCSCIKSVLSCYQNSRCPQVQEWISKQLGVEKLKQVCSFYKYEATINLYDLEWRLHTLLQGCEHIYDLTEDILRRKLSVMYYGGSKEFETVYMEKTAKILAPGKSFGNVSAREILKTFHVLENPACVWVKGKGTLTFQNGDVLHVADYPSGFALTRDCVNAITNIDMSRLLTIENLTTFNDFPMRENELVVFTSGYANSLVVRFIRLCASYSNLGNFVHFGDMDAYGFDILHDLSKRTGLWAQTYLMDIQTYEANIIRTVPMTKGNRALFARLIVDPFYNVQQVALFQRLLEDNKTLEQEGVKSYDLGQQS